MYGGLLQEKTTTRRENSRAQPGRDATGSVLITKHSGSTGRLRLEGMEPIYINGVCREWQEFLFVLDLECSMRVKFRGLDAFLS